MKTKGKIAGLILSALLLGSLGPVAVSAIEYGGIGGRPAHPDPKNPHSQSIFIYTLTPGSTKHDEVAVINNAKDTKTLEVYSTDSAVSSGGALTCEQQADKKDEVGKWIKVSRGEVTLPAASTRNVPFTVKVPDSASPGEHNGCLVVQIKNQQPIKQMNGIALTTRTGIRVAITVPGEVRREVVFTGYEVIKRKDRPGYILRTKVRNNGNVSIDTDIKTTTRSVLGPKVGGTDATYSVLPFTSSEYNFELKQPFWGLLYRSQPSLTYDSTPGQDGGDRHTNGPTAWFFVWPAPLAAGIELAILLILIGSVWMLRRWRLERRAGQDWEPYAVQSDDTLASIAKARGTSVRLLAKVNNVTKSYQPKPGESLKAPKER